MFEKYTGDKISDEDIRLILQAGLLSPSGKGIRPWEFIVVRDKNMLERLSDSRTGAADLLREADCAIIVICDKSLTDVWIEDCSIAMTQMHIMADSIGLGSCWIQGRMRKAHDGRSSCEFVRDLLRYPNSFELEAILSIGYPMDKKAPNVLSDTVSRKVHCEKY